MIVNELIEDGILLSTSTSNSSTINSMKDNRKRIWDIVAISNHFEVRVAANDCQSADAGQATIRYSISIYRLPGFRHNHAITCLLASLDNRWKKPIRIMLQTMRDINRERL